MFDPFGDFRQVGYLRNSLAEKDLSVVKAVEHELFRAQLSLAMDYLAGVRSITYKDFLEVHRILFSELYPWAGQDRLALTPNMTVRKGNVFFCDPTECSRAIEYGLRLGANADQIRNRPGHIMGLFAYGHPFLDGNGRTMLIVHCELCLRAGVSIAWELTKKTPYLQALSREIESPNDGHLDRYLRDFLGPALTRDNWLEALHDLQGLSGIEESQNQHVNYGEPSAIRAYEEFVRNRGYKIPGQID